MKFFVVSFLVLLAYASADEIQKSDQDHSELEKSYPEALGRLFLNGLNSTMLVVGVAILAGLLLFALYAAASPVYASQKTTHEYDPYADYYAQGGYYQDDQQYQTRYKRSMTGNVFFFKYY